MADGDDDDAAAAGSDRQVVALAAAETMHGFGTPALSPATCVLSPGGGRAGGGGRGRQVEREERGRGTEERRGCLSCASGWKEQVHASN